MSQNWLDQVSSMKSTLADLEQQVADGAVDTHGLEDLKSALDDLRLRAWGLLMSTTADDYKGFQERFRLRRTREMCTSITTDLRDGRLSPANPELPPLGDAMREFTRTVDQVRGRADRN